MRLHDWTSYHKAASAASQVQLLALPADPAKPRGSEFGVWTSPMLEWSGNSREPAGTGAAGGTGSRAAGVEDAQACQVLRERVAVALASKRGADRGRAQNGGKQDGFRRNLPWPGTLWRPSELHVGAMPHRRQCRYGIETLTVTARARCPPGRSPRCRTRWQARRHGRPT